MRKLNKGQIGYLVALFAILFALVIVILSFVTRVQEQVVIKEGFVYKTEFLDMIGEIKNIIYAGNMSLKDNRLILAENKTLDNRVYGWLSLYRHARDTDGIAYRYVNEKKEGIYADKLRDMIERRFNLSVNYIIPKEIFYKLSFEDINISRNEGKKIKSIGSIALPVISPGEKISYIFARREGTFYNLILRGER